MTDIKKQQKLTELKSKLYELRKKRERNVNRYILPVEMRIVAILDKIDALS